MIHYRALLRGRGTAHIIAYGPGDAEASLEKELRQILPMAQLSIIALRRIDSDPRIVELFAADYLLRVEIDAEGRDEARARRTAFAATRRALEGSRFSGISWENADLSPV